MDPCTAAGQEYIQYYEKNQGSTCNLDNHWKEETRGEFCSTCLPQYEKLLSNYVSVCGGNADSSIKLNHDAVQFYKAYYCGKDSTTGEYCSQVAFKGFKYDVPYSSWDPQLCKSSCVGIIDSAIRSVAGNADLMANNHIDASLFTGNSNPLSNCAGATAAGGASFSGSAAGAAGAGGAGGAGGINGGVGGVGGVNGANGINGANGATGTGAFGSSPTGLSFGTATPLNGNTSGANTLSPQICLLSLIMCLIFALLK